MIYTLLVGNALITIAILIFGIYMKSWGLVISMAITLAVYLLVLWCCW